MGTLSVRVEVSGAIARLRSVQARLANPRPVLKQFAEYLDLQVRERFDNEQEPDGTPWVPLADRTLREKANPKRRRGKSIDKILQDTAALRDTIISVTDSTSVAVGSNLRVGSYSLLALHQEGTKRMPARPVLGLTSADEQELQAILDDYLRG